MIHTLGSDQWNSFSGSVTEFYRVWESRRRWLFFVNLEIFFASFNLSRFSPFSAVSLLFPLPVLLPCASLRHGRRTDQRKGENDDDDDDDDDDDGDDVDGDGENDDADDDDYGNDHDDDVGDGSGRNEENTAGRPITLCQTQEKPIKTH